LKRENLAAHLRERIAALPGGTRLPSVRSLMARHHLSLQTVHAALRQLAAEDLIYSKRGSGSFVKWKDEQKLILLHRSNHHSPYEEAKETHLRSCIEAERWHLHVRRYDKPALLNVEEAISDCRASAHILAQDIAAMTAPLVSALAGCKVPVILMDREENGLPFHSVASNDQQILSLLVEHLVHLGHRHFALLVNEPDFPEIRQRRQLFQDALAARKLPPGIFIECETQPGESSPHKAYSTLSTCLAKNGPLPFSALLVASAAGGPGALRAFHERGIRVPKDCSIACCGWDPGANLLIPSLTTAGTSESIWGQWMVRLLKQIFRDTKHISAVRLPVELNLGESTGPAPGKVRQARHNGGRR
jgi:DNA-binding LacI/PurR family transcriptional regulator